MRTIMILFLCASIPALAGDDDVYVDNELDNDPVSAPAEEPAEPVEYEEVPADIVAMFPNLEGSWWTGTVPSGRQPPSMDFFHPECAAE